MLILNRDTVYGLARRRGWNMRELARQANLAEGTVYRSLRHEISPTLSSVGRMARALEVEPCLIMQWGESDGQGD